LIHAFRFNSLVVWFSLVAVGWFITAVGTLFHL